MTRLMAFGVDGAENCGKKINVGIFSNVSRPNYNYLFIFILSSAIAFILDQSKVFIVW